MKFLTVGEKIKETRKYLKMTQEDLQDESISRAMISMIEINIRELTKDAAIKVAQKFNHKAKELDLKFEIEENFLLRSPAEDAELYCLKKLEILNINDDIEEILEIAGKFNLLEITASCYSKKADLYMDIKDYDTAFTNYNDAIAVYKDIKQNKIIPHLYFQMGLCKAKALRYKDSLSYFDICERYSVMYKDTKTLQLVLYDTALSYKKIDKIDLALKSIERYLRSSNKDDDYYFYGNILKANCYQAMGKYDAVIEIYNSLLAELPKPKDSVLGYIYNNLGLAYLDKLDFKTSLEYLEKAENIRNLIDKPNLCHTLIEKSEIFFRQELYTDAIQTTKSGLTYAEIYKDYECLLKGNYALSRIYESMSDFANLKNVYLIIIDLLKANNNLSEVISIYVKLSLIYLNENNYEETKKYLVMSQYNK